MKKSGDVVAAVTRCEEARREIHYFAATSRTKKTLRSDDVVDDSMRDESEFQFGVRRPLLCLLALCLLAAAIASEWSTTDLNLLRSTQGERRQSTPQNSRPRGSDWVMTPLRKDEESACVWTQRRAGFALGPLVVRRGWRGAAAGGQHARDARKGRTCPSEGGKEDAEEGLCGSHGRKEESTASGRRREAEK